MASVAFDDRQGAGCNDADEVDGRNPFGWREGVINQLAVCWQSSMPLIGEAMTEKAELGETTHGSDEKVEWLGNVAFGCHIGNHMSSWKHLTTCPRDRQYLRLI